MPRAFLSDSFNDIHELKYGQAEEKLEAGGDEKLIFNFIWPKLKCHRLAAGIMLRILVCRYLDGT